MQVAKIVIVEGQSQFNMLNVLAGDLAYSFRQKGIQVEQLNLSQKIETINDNIERLREWQPDLMVSFCPHGLFRKPEANKQLWIWEYLDCPHICWVVDSALTHFPYIYPALNSKNLILACADEYNEAWLKICIPEVKAFYLPHAVNFYEESESSEVRDVPLSFLSSIGNMQSMELSNFAKDFSPSMYDVLVEVSDFLWNNPEVFIWDALVEHIKQADIKDITLDKDLPLLIKMFVIIEQYLRTRKKLFLVNALGDFDLHVWGSTQWESVKGSFVYHGTVSFAESAAVFRKSDCSLHIQTSQIIGGLHERILSAMLGGSLVISEYTKELRRSFINGENIILFNPSKPEELVPFLKNFLLDKTRITSMAASAKQQVIKEHTMHNRVEKILSVLNKFNI